MAAISSNEILRTIRKNGYWVSDNPAIGKRVDAVLIPRIDLQTAEALELLKASAFDDEVRRFGFRTERP